MTKFSTLITEFDAAQMNFYRASSKLEDFVNPILDEAVGLTHHKRNILDVHEREGEKVIVNFKMDAGGDTIYETEVLPLHIFEAENPIEAAKEYKVVINTTKTLKDRAAKLKQLKKLAQELQVDISEVAE